MGGPIRSDDLAAARSVDYIHRMHQAIEGARGRRRRGRRRRRIAGALVMLAPGALVIATDAFRRWDHIERFDPEHRWGYLATAAVTVVFWAILLHATARPRGRLRQPAAGLFTLAFTLAYGVQNAFFDRFAGYLNLDTQVFALSFPRSLLGYLPFHAGVAAWLFVAFAIAITLVALARTFLRPRPIARLAAAPLLVAALVGISQVPASYRVWQSTTPDVIYFHGLIAEIDERRRTSDYGPELKVQRRDPETIPPLSAQPKRPRNVLFILQESLRYDVTCNAYDPEAIASDPPRCATPFSNRAVPARHPFEQMRAQASSTAISISVLWSGLAPHLSYDALHRAPLLWDYAKAAGWQTAYFTSQHVLFGNMRLYVQDLPLDHVAYATHLDTMAAFDEGASDAALTDRVIAEWDALAEPFFAVVHYSNVHHPYVYDPNRAPFQPSLNSRRPEHHEAYFNFYKNVAYLSDHAVGRLLDHVRDSDRGRRTVVIYTADHGEAFGEHWQRGHTSALFDEEIHVPSWIDAPPGTLDAAEEGALRTARDLPTFHVDVAPTVLDLIGIWDAPTVAPFRAKMIGSPLTREARTVAPVPLSNCSWVWECAFRNWGVMQGFRKVEARQWDARYHCFDLATDPFEQYDLGEEGCPELAALGRAWFGPMPFEAWPGGKDLLFGPPPEPAAKQN